MSIKQELIELFLDSGAVQRGKVTLSSGKKSDLFIDAKRVLMCKGGMQDVVNLVSNQASMVSAAYNTVGGPANGAFLLVSALLATPSHFKNGFVLNKDGSYEGYLPNPKDKVLIVEDVVTTGKSVKRVIDFVELHGATVGHIVCIVDREEGAAETLNGYSFSSLLTKKDLL